jgi:hypothetical protein
MATITPTNNVNPTTMASNWGKGVSANAQKWLAKYLAPKRLFNANPQQSQADWVAGVTQAQATNKYMNGLANADVTAAANNASQYGVTNYAQSGTTKAYKFAAKTNALAAAINASVQAADATPRGPSGSQANIARMTAFATTMHSFKGKI